MLLLTFLGYHLLLDGSTMFANTLTLNEVSSASQRPTRVDTNQYLPTSRVVLVLFSTSYLVLVMVQLVPWISYELLLPALVPSASCAKPPYFNTVMH